MNVFNQNVDTFLEHIEVGQKSSIPSVLGVSINHEVLGQNYTTRRCCIKNTGVVSDKLHVYIYMYRKSYKHIYVYIYTYVFIYILTAG
jgi:hypothetical protein